MADSGKSKTAVRIQKVLAEAGVASRRSAEQMVLDGRVTVNGSVVESLPCFVDPASDDIRVDGGRAIRPGGERKVYFLLNKPRSVVCTQRDPAGRKRAVDLIPPVRERVHCVGRLDADSTGLIVLTNDGELTQLLTHPSCGVIKTYVVEAAGRVGGEVIEKLKSGLWMAGGRTRGAGVKVLHRGPKRTLLEVRLGEGRNRQVRRMLAKLGHTVRRLKRVAIGPITDRGLKIGHCRTLTHEEVAKLRRVARASANRR